MIYLQLEFYMKSLKISKGKSEFRTDNKKREMKKDKRTNNDLQN